MSNGILVNQLPNSALGLQGNTPPTLPGANINSTLHNQSSINNNPAINREPSVLDLDGLTPPKYLDNPPG
jgi:hypothetical protein|tara:strand:+ start:73 stop:282 length:210 start_codon:yes stop_codon:yes gene_type:complete